MYLFGPKELAISIRKNELSKRGFKLYYLGTTVFTTFTLYLCGFQAPTNGALHLLEMLLNIGVVFYGISITYTANKGDQGQDYIARMTALSLPVIIQLNLINVGASVLLSTLYENQWFQLAKSIVLQFVYFFWLKALLEEINKD